MRRLGTSLLLATVLGIAVAAAVDALPEDRASTARPSRPRPDQTLVQALRAAGVAGVLTYADADCRLHAIRLPSLRQAKAPAIESCEPHIPSGGIGAWKGDVVWSGLGFQTVQVVLSKEELTQGLRQRGWEVTGGYRAAQAVPLVEGQYAVLAAPEPKLLVFVRRGRIEMLVSAFLGEDVVLRPSPGGHYVAAIDREERRLRVFSADGTGRPLPEIANPHAITWSPDERWTALATRWSIYLFRTARPDGTVLRIPLAVRDLDWDA